MSTSLNHPWTITPCDLPRRRAGRLRRPHLPTRTPPEQLPQRLQFNCSTRSKDIETSRPKTQREVLVISSSPEPEATTEANRAGVEAEDAQRETRSFNKKSDYPSQRNKFFKGSRYAKPFPVLADRAEMQARLGCLRGGEYGSIFQQFSSETKGLLNKYDISRKHDNPILEACIAIETVEAELWDQERRFMWHGFEQLVLTINKTHRTAMIKCQAAFEKLLEERGQL
ncbi:hypothetical protein BJ508DRAFT_365462 [Ascobolus immersus RN42]|uniref:Uncharacterized protein n=1 Tax=Ascobolus immersus RN42 TaxID=1160509 RepID=A0A3N4HS35_ASCIM|nr:hypothetical protein BJ508DRAFT_365462 [Ascobolus immersus RN42]